MKTEIIAVNPQYPELNKIAYCARVVRQGGLVIFPTETVYGIAADYSNPKAIKRLKEVKKRSHDKPFSVLISQKGLIANYTSIVDPKLFKLIDAYWPGPLTVVVPLKEPGKTIGLRMPDHLIALKFAEECQCPVAAPSANEQGEKPATTCQEAIAALDGQVDVAIDGGPSKLGIGSSVVDLTQERPVLLREGSISQADIDKQVNKRIVLFVCTGNSCRSVMAEYTLKDYMKGRSEVEVFSAGTGVFFPTSASAETIAVLKEDGIDATRHLSRPLSSILLKKADLIFVMTRVHRQQVLERVPDVEKRVYLLREFVNIPSGFPGEIDIPDPIGKAHFEYKECLTVIKEAISKIKELI
jgi:tRNA threonylcarbamoyl adenosine modification protein (Sua5/YciO/YrdC/YwlC family)